MKRRPEQRTGFVDRRTALRGIVAGLVTLPLLGCGRRGQRAVGFSQMDTGGAWRGAETSSIRQAAGEHGYEVVVTAAEDQTAKQLSDVEDLIARRVRAVLIAPREYEGLASAFETARRAGIPILLIDREARGTPGVDFVTSIGSDFVEQGRRAARWLCEATGERAAVLELTGTAGSSVARDRSLGFREGLEGHENVRIIASQTASFACAPAQAVVANLLQARGHETTAIYAHNDEMALGAIQALQAAGRQPGRDVTLVSIDDEKAALEAILRGELGASIESNPRFGPLAFDLLERHLRGESVPPRVILPDRLFDRTNAGEFLSEAY